MKKTVLIVCMALILILGNVTAALADAITYDVEDAGYYVYVATPDGGLNMRQGPGTGYNKVMEGRIPDGVRLYIEMVSKNWGYTTYNGNYGWVALSQTTKTAPAPAKPAVEDADYYVYVATPDGGLNIRQGPGTEYDKVMEGRIPDGVKLHIESVSGNWGYTSYDGHKGWVALSQTTQTPPVEQPAESSEEVQPSDVTEEEPDADNAEAETEEKQTDAIEEKEPEQDNSGEVKAVRSALLKQIILIAVLVFLVVAMAVVIVIVINTRAKR